MPYTTGELIHLSKAKIISRTHYGRCHKCGLWFWNRVLGMHRKACKKPTRR
jgi:hypothetical protein